MKLKAFVLGSRSHRIVAAVVVSVVSLTILGAVVVAMTPLGCGPSKALQMKLSSSCQTLASNSGPQVTSPFSTPATTIVPGPGPERLTTTPTPTAPPAPSPISSLDTNGSGSGFLVPSNPFACGSSCESGLSTGLTLNCKLPVFDEMSESGGFIILPSGTFQPDPRSAVKVPPGTAQPRNIYPDWFGTTYDSAYSKWLPVPYAWVSPDGTHYAYPGVDGIYVQNVANGSQMILGAGKVWEVLDVETVGVYAKTVSTGGLWLLPFSGVEKQITSAGFWYAVNKTAAYGTATSSVPQGVVNTILKLDLSTGATSEWFTAPPFQSGVIGFDFKGNPVIQTSAFNLNAAQPDLTSGIWITIAPNRGYLISISSGSYGLNPRGTPIGDSHGLWFSSRQGMVLYATDGTWHWVTGLLGQFAGGCK